MLGSGLTIIPGPAGANQGGILTASGTQGIGGDKTPTGTWTFNKTDTASTADVIAIMRISSDNTGRIIFQNATSVDGTFIGKIVGVGTSSNQALIYQGDATVDAGNAPVIAFNARTAAATAIATRPPFEFQNNGTANVQITAAGGVVISGGTAPGLTVGASGTKITQTRVYSQTITPASVAANTTAEQTFTVTGLTTADKVNLNPGAAPTAGTGIVGVRASAADTLAVTYANNTAGALTPVSSTCLIIADRS